MEKEEIKKRINKLKKVINYHRYLYHVLDKQEISDAVLDSLKHELSNLEKKYPEFITLDSPTRRIGGQPVKEFKKVKHEIPMLSIEDVFSEKELRDWEEYIKRLVIHHFLQKNGEGVEYFAELKIDGFAITLIYEKGLFITGATRGNGREGEDVTKNLKTIESIPLKLEFQKGISDKKIEENLTKTITGGKIEIRGEVYMKKKDFEKLNEELKRKGEKTFANPRNLAAGSIRQLNPKLAASRPLKFLAYDIVTDIGQKSHSQEHQILPFLGFKTDPGKICKNLSDVLNFWKYMVKKRENLPFQIDGIVISINDNLLFNKLGIIGKSPRGIRALKFFPKQSTTKILDIRVQVGRTGAITPVASLEPVEVGGVTITRATLHNEDEIKKLGVKIGDTVIIERAGDVIPAVTKVMPELRTGEEKTFYFPKTCPICGKKLVKSEEEAVWRCNNLKCPARKRENLYYFASKKAFDIEGLGPKIIDKLADAGLISEAIDLFGLKEGDIIPLENLSRRKPKAFLRGFGKKSTQNLIQSIQNSKKIILPRFILSLGIRHVGEETAATLSDYFGSIDKLKKATEEDLNRIPDIGEKISESVYNWFQSEINQKFIDELLIVGVKIIPHRLYSKSDEGLKGKTFVLTGVLETMTREEAKEKVRFLGGDISESVSKMTDYLVVGENPGSKLEQAKKLGTNIIDEKQFLDMIK